MNQPLLNKENLQSNIRQDLHACGEIMRLLEREREALSERDTEKLEAIIKEKASSLAQLEINAKQRTSWLRDHGATKTVDLTEKWDQLIKKTAPELSSNWQELKSMLGQCQIENEINGKLLARNQQVFSRLLSILRGQGSAQNTYSMKNTSRSAHGGHSLGEA